MSNKNQEVDSYRLDFRFIVLTLQSNYLIIHFTFYFKADEQSF